jgi:hypothetical protein
MVNHALEVSVDGQRRFVAAADEVRAVACSVMVGVERGLVCNTNQLCWPRTPLALGSVVSIRLVADVVGDPPTDPETAGFRVGDRARADALEAAEAALPPPSTLRCLRVGCGQHLVLAGVRRGVLFLEVSLVQRDGFPTCAVRLYGMDTIDHLAHRWLHDHLHVNERITVEVLDANKVDEPLASIPARWPP